MTCLACDQAFKLNEIPVKCHAQHMFHKDCFLTFPKIDTFTICIVCRQWSGNPCCLCNESDTESNGEQSVVDELLQQGVSSSTHWAEKHRCVTCKWCEVPILQSNIAKHELLSCKALRCPICQEFTGSSPCIHYKKCGHLIHGKCLKRWPEIFPKSCFICFPFTDVAAFNESVGPISETMMSILKSRCILKCDADELTTSEQLFDHLIAQHKPGVCKYCGLEYVVNSMETHLNFCLKRDAICPAFGCKVRVPTELIDQSHDDARCLFNHHRCKYIYCCDTCGKYVRSVKKFDRHIKAHTPQDFESAVFLRPKRRAFKRVTRIFKRVFE